MRPARWMPVAYGAWLESGARPGRGPRVNRPVSAGSQADPSVLRFPPGGESPSIAVHSRNSPAAGRQPRKTRFPTIWHAAAERLAAAKSSDWQDSQSAEAAWGHIEKLEPRLLEPAVTVIGLAGKLLYLLRLIDSATEHDRKSWRYRLLRSALADAERLATPSITERAYQRLRRLLSKSDARAREQANTIDALRAELEACQLRLAETLRQKRQ